jgi:nucleoside-diphosphate-sugar epimerase
VAHAGKPDIKHVDRWFATTNRLRAEGTDHLLAAAEATGVSHFVAQSYASWNGIRKGGWVKKTEEDPLDLHAGTAAHAGMEAIRHAEDVVLRALAAQSCDTAGSTGRAPPTTRSSSCASGNSRSSGAAPATASWVHLDDAASATVLAVEQKARGVFNIVDEEPAPASEWLPLSGCVRGRKATDADPKWLARLLAGEVVVTMMTEGRGFSNAKARRELGWELRYPSWRKGFKKGWRDPG